MLRYIHKTIRNVKSSEAGFTLLEVIMAVSILTIGLLAVASLQVTAMRGNSMSLFYTESTERVQDRVEKLLNKNFTDVDLSDRTVDGLDGINDIGDDADGNQLQQRSSRSQRRNHHDFRCLGALPYDGKDEDGDTKYKVYWNVVEDWAGGPGGKVVNGVNTIRVIVRWTEKGKDYDYSFDLLRNRI